MKTSSLLSLLAAYTSLAFLGASQVRGEVIIFNFVGQVTSVYNPLGLIDPSLIHLGSPVQASIQYDTTTPDLALYASDPTRGAFIGPGAVRVNINGFKFEQDNTIQVDILNGAVGGQHLFQAGGYYHPTAWPSDLPVMTYPIIFMAFSETGPPIDLFTDAELPTWLDFSRADVVNAFVRTGTVQNAYEIKFSLVQIPEPTVVGLLGLAFISISFRSRQSR